MSSLLVVFFCHWSTGIVSGIGDPPFVADHLCVSSLPEIMTHVALIGDEDPLYLIVQNLMEICDQELLVDVTAYEEIPHLSKD